MWTKWLFRFVLSGWLTVLPFLLWAHDPNEKRTFLIPNAGQWPKEVIAQVELPAMRIYIEQDGIRWQSAHPNDVEAMHQAQAPDQVRMHAWKTTFVGSSFQSGPEFIHPLPFKRNYFLGNNPQGWASDLTPYQTLVLPNFYPGIDLRFDVRDGFKYEFVVQPGANPKLIAAEVAGLPSRVLPDGRLHYVATTGDFYEEAPVAWTETAAQKAVSIAFKATKQGWTFDLGAYDRRQTLVLDPRLVASTYSGSTSDNWGFTATYGPAGEVFLGGLIFNPGYPTTLGAYQANHAGMEDMSISKYSSDGTSLLYSTYLGGSSEDVAMSMVVDQAGLLYLLGKSNSNDFPVSFGAYDPTLNGGFDLVISKLNATGSGLLGSTYLGGSMNESQNAGNGMRFNLNALEFNYGDDSRGEILLDQQGNVLVVSNTISNNYPMVGAVQGTFGGVQDGVLSKLNPSLTSLLYSTYLGGSDMDAAYSVLSAGADTVYVVGSTFSGNFPLSTLAQGHQRVHNGSCDGFLIRMRTAPGPMLSGTFIGTNSYDQAYQIDLDSQRVYVNGISLGNMPVQPAGLYHVPNARHFIQRFSANLGALELSTTFGISGANGPSFSPTAFLVDRCSKIYVSGWGGSTNTQRNPFTSPMLNLPTTANAMQGNTDGSDMYIAVFEANMQSLLYGTFFGGSSSSEHVDGGTCRFSKEGVIYHAVCAGCGGNSDFPTSPGAWSPNNLAGTGGGRCNAAVFKIDLEYATPRAAFTTQYLDTTVCLNATVQFRPIGTQTGDFYWDFGVPGATSTQNSPTYTYTSTGTYLVTMVVSTCIGSDTMLQQVTVAPPPQVQIDQIGPACYGDSISLRASGGVQYLWQADTTLSSYNVAEPRVLASSSRWYVVTATNAQGCSNTDSIWLEVVSPQPVFAGINAQWCYGDTLRVQPQLGHSIGQVVWLPDPDISDSSQIQQAFVSMPPRWVYVQITDTAGCVYLDSLRLNPEVTVTAEAGPDRYVCNNDSLTITATGGTRFLWNTGDTTASITVSTNSQQAFWVSAFIDNCRSLPDTMWLYNATIEAAFTFDPDTGYSPQKVQFTNLSNAQGQARFLWDFGDGNGSTEPNPTHIYRQPGAYRIWLQVTSNLSNCTDSLGYEFLIIDSIQILLPNAFTPNGDGVNDFFEGVLRNFQSLEFQVFDRWGMLIYTSYSEVFAWDGKQNGQEVPAGAYPYVLKAIGKNGRPYNRTGQIILIR